VPDFSLPHRSAGNNIAAVLASLTVGLDDLFAKTGAHCVIAQGDTTSVLAAATAAFYRRLPFIHVEAGLRTGDLGAPFPEEYHRRAVAVSTFLHCAPTETAALALIAENIPDERIVLSGNTVIDALLATALMNPPAPSGFPHVARPILMTAHRRENFDHRMREMFAAIRAFVDGAPDTGVMFPLHPNPAARSVARDMLSDHPRIALTEPLSYREIVGAMRRAWLILTDSGGLQEEAPALGKPVLVLRDVTERPEAVAAGAVRVIGTKGERVLAALRELHADPAAYARMARPVFPYGDGHAAERIVAALQRHMTGHGMPAAPRMPLPAAAS
jgi:UDP-N-acetylglucosamine 2-epimerase (non-hydrolysing)